MNSDEDYWNQLEESLAKSSHNLIGLEGPDEINKVCDHIFSLLVDAHLLINGNSCNTAAFMLITAIEECAKADICIYRKTSAHVKRSEDPLYSHVRKHSLAANPIALIGTRLGASLGQERVEGIFQDLAKGKYKAVREEALYFTKSVMRLHIPKEQFSKREVSELLLVAIEIVDDRLVGYTDHTFSMGEKLDELYRSTEMLLNEGDLESSTKGNPNKN